MPTICVFYGITIRMYYDDHMPPHYHAYHGEHSVAYCIRTGARLAGRLPRREEAMVLDWARRHQFALRRNWKLACQHRALLPVKELE